MTVNIHTPLRADSRGWGSGWPHCSVHPVSLTVSGVSFPGGVAPEVHDLMVALLEESEDRKMVTLHPGWCWGFGCRPITGTTSVPSNHSWGLAIDINAPVNGYGASSHTIPASMGKLWNDWGFRWGGDYTSTKDWMHFEFMGTPAEARALGNKARRELQGDDDQLTKREKQQLEEATAFVKEVRQLLGPGKKVSPAGAAGSRVGRATLKTESTK